MYRRCCACLAGLVASLLCAAAQAIPAAPYPMPVKNSDGSTLMARMFGDEHLSWIEDEAGYAIAFDPASGDWHYAQRGPDGRLVPTSTRVGHADPSSLGVKPHLTPSREALERARARRAQAHPLRHHDTPPGPRVVPNLVLLVQFANQTAHFQPADFDPVYNGPTGSVNAFYTEISSGTWDLKSTVVGWIPLPHDDLYYVYNEVHPNDGHPELMIVDAIAWLDAQGFDFSPFDSDHDGYIDAVDVVHSGYSYETTMNPSYIHSHEADLPPGFAVTKSGLSFSAYHTESEYAPDNKGILHIGVICHETAHFFGALDLYDTTYQSAGLGDWSLMAMGEWQGPNMDQSVPTHPDAWTKILIGMGSSTTLASDTKGQRVTPAEIGPDFVRIDDGMPSGQYFLIENRQRTGFDHYLPGTGLLIYHVDENQNDNTDPDDYVVDLEQADGLRQLNLSPYATGDADDPYPNGLGNDSFTPVSNPSSIAYYDVSSSIWVENITRDGQDVTFDLTLLEPAQNGTACTSGGYCASSFCIDGFCCDAACADPSGCHACAVSQGAQADGHCTELSGKACDDQEPCTLNDTCAQGVCVGTPMPCPGDACHLEGHCVRGTGDCAFDPKPDGTPCDDGDACTRTDTCQGGWCKGGDPVSCTPTDNCHGVGACDPATGACNLSVFADGTKCGDNKLCKDGACVDGPALTPTPTASKSSCSSAGTGAASPFALLALAALAWRRRVKPVAGPSAPSSRA